MPGQAKDMAGPGEGAAKQAADQGAGAAKGAIGEAHGAAKQAAGQVSGPTHVETALSVARNAHGMQLGCSCRVHSMVARHGVMGIDRVEWHLAAPLSRSHCSGARLEAGDAHAGCRQPREPGKQTRCRGAQAKDAAGQGERMAKDAAERGEGVAHEAADRGAGMAKDAAGKARRLLPRRAPATPITGCGRPLGPLAQRLGMPCSRPARMRPLVARADAHAAIGYIINTINTTLP